MNKNYRMASPTKKEVEDLIRYVVNRAKREINSNKMLLKKKITSQGRES